MLLFGVRSLVPFAFPLGFLLLAWPLPYLVLLEQALGLFTTATALAVREVVVPTGLATLETRHRRGHNRWGTRTAVRSAASRPRVWPVCHASAVRAIAEELGRLRAYEERHRRLLSRLALVFAATLVVDLAGTVAMYFVERHSHGTEIRTFGDSLFFTTVQLLTVSSQIRNPLTGAGRVVDVLLEIWAVIVVAGSAGALASFFQSADSRS